MVLKSIEEYLLILGHCVVHLVVCQDLTQEVVVDSTIMDPKLEDKLIKAPDLIFPV